MARTSSIFYLAQQNKLGHNATPPVSLSAIMNPSTAISRFHRERLERVQSDISSARSVCTTLKTLFEVCHIKQEDLTSAPAPTVFKNVRTFLKHRIQIEVALIGNPKNFSIDSVFRITASYNLNKDPDIVAAKELQASKRMNTFAKHRLEQASLKINNFLMLLHVFEAIYLIVDNNKLNGEQCFQINQFLENSIFPAEGKQFLQTCFTQLMEQPIVPMELAPEKKFLKPLTGTILENYLKFLAKIALYAYTKPDFSGFIYENALKKYYLELHIKLKPQMSTIIMPQKEDNSSKLNITKFNFLDTFAKGKAEAFSYISHQKLASDVDYSHNHPQGIYLSTENNELQETKYINRLRTLVLRAIKSAGFYEPNNLKFMGNNSIIYINDIAVSNPNLYFTSCNPNEYSMWNFAITNRMISSLFNPEGHKTFAELDIDARKKFALGLNGQNGVFHLNYTIGFILGGNLEYRLLVEGFLGTINEQERRHAFMWLVQWYNQFFANHDKIMHDFTPVLEYLGDIISLYSYLYPNDITPSVNIILAQHPYANLYHQLILAKLHSTGELKLSAELIPHLFQIYINANPEYNLFLRLNAQSALLLRRQALRYFKHLLQQNPTILQELYQNINQTNKPFVLKDKYNVLAYYKNSAIACLLPPCLEISFKQKILQSIIAQLRDLQKPLINYLQNNGRNVQNEIVYRLLESELEASNTTNASLEAFKSQLLNGGIFAYDEIKQLFNININNRNDVLHIIAECADACNISMCPDPRIENYELVISTFSHVSFVNKTITLPKNANSVILPYRLALETSTSYVTKTKLLSLFQENLKTESEFDDEEREKILEYANYITQISKLSNGSCRAGIKLLDQNFSKSQKQAMCSYFNLLTSMGDQHTTLKNIKALNTKLKGHFLSVYLDNNTYPSTVNKSSVYTQKIGNWNGESEFIVDEIFNAPTKLDQNLIAKKMKETTHVQDLLTPIFTDEQEQSNTISKNDEPLNYPKDSVGTELHKNPNLVDAKNDINMAKDQSASNDNASPLDELPPAHRRLLMRLMQLPEFTKEDFKKLCLEEKLMPSAALEVINEWAYNTFDCSILEENDIMFFDRELLSELN